MALPLDDLSLLDEPQGGQPGPSGAPLQLPMDLIDEDPDQPRTEFDPQALQELSETIALRGVRQPISVRPHPASPGRWLLNFGARRLRASRLAGRESIPAFIDDTADSFDQVIENEQRQSLTPLELALFVQRQLGAGQSLADVGKRLGKSRTYMTFVAALIDAPDWLLQVYRRGACRGVTELYELRKAHEKSPELVLEWLNGTDAISRADILALKARCAAAVAPTAVEPAAKPTRDAAVPTASRASGAAPASAEATHSEGSAAPTPPLKGTAAPAERLPRVAQCSAMATAPNSDANPAHEPRLALQANWRGRRLRVTLDAVAGADGLVCLAAEDDRGESVAAPIGELTDLQLRPQ